MPETPSQIIGHIFSGVVGGLIVALLQSLMSRSSSRVLKHEEDIRADKLRVIPVIDGLIAKAAIYPAPNIVRREGIIALQDHYRRFCLHLKGGKLRAFTKAWQALEQTTEQEMLRKDGQGVFTDDQIAEFKQVSKILITRLKAFREATHDA